MSAFSFAIHTRDGKARTGTITTPNGTIETPAFSPVGTKANVKGVFPDTLKGLGAQVVLANTYHLYLQPGEEIVKNAGGLAKFMGWNGPTMTDSGGYQVFSLGAAFGRTVSKFVKAEDEVTSAPTVYDEEVATQHGQLAIIDEEGVTFTSHIDGTLHRFTPERSVEIQHALGADMFFAFDECTSATASYEYQKEAMERTHRWAKRSLDAHRRNLEARKSQAIFGIVQGGRYEDLRAESAKEIASLGFDGIGIGGSFSKEDMRGALQAAVEHLPEELPRHFLGIGEPGDVLEGIANGMDLFDCVAPTRIGRHGTIYTMRGPISLVKAEYAADYGPLDPECVVPGTETFTRAYVSHLFRAKEWMGGVIAATHNEGFIVGLVDGARKALQEGRFKEYCDTFRKNYYRN